MKYLYIALLLGLITSCAQEKGKMLEAFEQQMSVINSGQVDQFYDMLTLDSRAFIDKLTDPDNMSKDKLMQLCKAEGLDYWCADYYTSMSHFVKSDPKKEQFFYYLLNSSTPLFSFQKDFYADKQKSRVGDKNYVLLVNDLEGGYRNVTWLEYILENEQYKLKLLDLLKQDESKSNQLFYGYAKTQYDNKIPKDWKEKSLGELYRLPVSLIDLSTKDYDKTKRQKTNN